MRLEITYRFVNIDKPEEYIDIKTYGDGLDTGDKAPGKAMTYGDKYALMKGYKISTGDDPDKEASVETSYKKVEPNEDNKLILISQFNDLVEETNQDLEKY
jgi:ERF superfamily.